MGISVSPLKNNKHFWIGKHCISIFFKTASKPLIYFTDKLLSCWKVKYKSCVTKAFPPFSVSLWFHYNISMSNIGFGALWHTWRRARWWIKVKYWFSVTDENICTICFICLYRFLININRMNYGNRWTACHRGAVVTTWDESSAPESKSCAHVKEGEISLINDMLIPVFEKLNLSHGKIYKKCFFYTVFWWMLMQCVFVNLLGSSRVLFSPIYSYLSLEVRSMVTQMEFVSA